MKVAESWRPVVGYEDFYEVSDRGRVRSLDRVIDSKTPTGIPCTKKIEGRVLQPIPDTSGHLGVRLSIVGVAKRRLIHQLVLEAFVGPRPAGYHGCHNDDNKRDNSLANLRWDTPKENMKDRRRNGGVLTCLHGHAWSENEVIRRDGWQRYCRECHRIEGARRCANAM